jgi:hypothetical protein
MRARSWQAFLSLRRGGSDARIGIEKCQALNGFYNRPYSDSAAVVRNPVQPIFSASSTMIPSGPRT